MAQLPVVPLQVFRSSAVQNPTNIDSGPKRWWVSSDMTVGITVSNQWLDRIVGSKSWQMDTTKSPTNRLGGVRFNGTQFLTNDLPFSQINDATTGKGTVFIIFTYDANGNQLLSGATDGRGPTIDTSGNFKYIGGGITAVIGPIPAAKTNDVACVFDSSSGKITYYTNGAPALTNAASSITQINMGGIASGAEQLTGEITEVYISSNALSDASVLLLHNYGKATYNYTP